MAQEMNDRARKTFERIAPLIPDNPEKALQKLLPRFYMAEVAPVAAPSAAQFRVIRGLDPYTNTGLSEIRRLLIAGRVRFGPQHRAVLRMLHVRLLKAGGLVVTLRPATPAELEAEGLLSTTEPEYFQNPEQEYE
jgi:hypothetical protein